VCRSIAKTSVIIVAMSDDSYTEEQARLDVYEFLAKNPNALNLGKSQLIAEIESFKHDKYKKRKTTADYCRENRGKKRKLDTKTRIILLLTRIMSFHVYVLERYDICMVRCDAQRWKM